jgi:hypothetical protein
MVCYYAEGHYAGCPILFAVMLNVIMLSVVMLNVIMLSVVMLSVVMLNVIMLTVFVPRRFFETSVIFPGKLGPTLEGKMSHPGRRYPYAKTSR